YAQITGGFAFNFNIRFPTMFTAITKVFSLASLDFVSVVPIGCILPSNYHNRLLFFTVGPILVFFGLLIPFTLMMIGGEKMREKRNRIFNVFLIITFIILPSTSTKILNTFYCDEMDDVEGVPGDGGWYLKADLSIDCNSDGHKFYTRVALVMILVFPIGTPLMYFYQLYTNRHLIDCGQDKLVNTAMIKLVSNQGEGWQVVAQERERGSEVARESTGEDAYSAIKNSAEDATVEELEELEKSGAMAKLKKYAAYEPKAWGFEVFETGDAVELEDNSGDLSVLDASSVVTEKANSLDTSEKVHTGARSEFALDQKITRAKVGDGVKKVGGSAFNFCSRLVDFDMSEAEVVGERAFFKCTSLREVKGSPRLRSIEGSAFQFCNSLTRVTVQDSLKSIGPYAFAGCPDLVDIYLPASVTSVDATAFKGCVRLEERAAKVELTVEQYLRILPNFLPAITACLEEDAEGVARHVASAIEMELAPGCKRPLLHFVCMKPALATPKLIKAIVSASPDSKEMRDAAGKRAMDYTRDAGTNPLVIAMLQYLTTEEIAQTPESRLKALVKSKVQEQKTSDAAREMIVYEGARTEITALQEKMYKSYEKGDAQQATRAFEEMKRLSKEQSDRLSDLIEMVMGAYRNADVSRFEKIEQLENVSTGAKQLAVGGGGDRVAALLNKAAWMETAYAASMKELEEMFNGAKSIAEVCKKVGVDDEGGMWTRWGGKKVAMRVAAFSLDKVDRERVVKMRMGSPKGTDRAKTKLEEGRDLLDLNRVEFVFEDPLLLVLMCECLKSKYKLVTLKNKYKQEGGWEQPPDLHLNLDIGGGWIAEAQLLFRNVVEIKEELHKFYSVTRATRMEEVMKPLFKSEVGR
ncbi:hypothetical protein TeGR_g13545, partial [Tetraparma gracilis]